MSQQPHVVSTQLVTCPLMCITHMSDDPPVQALLVTYSDGRIEARCPLRPNIDHARHADPPQYLVCGYEYKP